MSGNRLLPLNQMLPWPDLGLPTLPDELVRRGFDAVDTDYDGYIAAVTLPDRDEPWPLWRQDRIEALLDRRRCGGPRFVSGTVADQDRF